MVDRGGPGRLPDPGLADAEELAAVEVAADLLVVGVAAIDNHGMGVEALLAPWARLQPAAQAALPAGHPDVRVNPGRSRMYQHARGRRPTLEDYFS